MDKKQIEAIVTRVTDEVRKEISVNETGAFRVDDLKAQLDGLSAAGNTQAWKISYDTSSSVLQKPRGEGLTEAWTISYDTSSSRVARDISGEK